MSSPQPSLPPVEVRERAVCMCHRGDACSSFAPGHALHLIQARLASATPSEWIDAVVDSVDPRSGEIVVRSIADAEPIALWNGTGAAGAVPTGTPVALHARYHVLAVGAARFNVAHRQRRSAA